jgi:hypothetical protein
VGGSEPVAGKVVKDDSRLVPDREARRCCKAGSVGDKTRWGKSKATKTYGTNPDGKKLQVYYLRLVILSLSIV